MAEVSTLKEMALPEFAAIAKAEPMVKFFTKDPECKLPIEFKAELFFNSTLPVLALDGENCTFDGRMPFVYFIQNTPAGHVLMFEAIYARKSRIRWSRFRYSIRQPGFVNAWLTVTEITVIPDTESVSDWVKRLRSESGVPMDYLARQNAQRAKDAIPLPGTPDFEDFIIEQAKVTNSAKKKQDRKKAPKVESIYKTIVRADFLANALWCRSTSDIVSEYFPDSKADEHEKHERSFNKAFSALKLSKARRNDIPQCPDISG
jgi:hypothetical protein